MGNLKKNSCCWEVNLEGYLWANNKLTHGEEKMTPQSSHTNQLGIRTVLVKFNLFKKAKVE